MRESKRSLTHLGCPTTRQKQVEWDHKMTRLRSLSYLEDDKLISQVSIATDQLLVLPKERSTNANDAFLVIQVHLKPVWLNSERPKFGFLFD